MQNAEKETSPPILSRQLLFPATNFMSLYIRYYLLHKSTCHEPIKIQGWKNKERRRHYVDVFSAAGSVCIHSLFASFQVCVSYVLPKGTHSIQSNLSLNPPEK